MPSRTSIHGLILILASFSAMTSFATSTCTYAYIANQGPNTISVIDTSANAIVDTVALPGPNGAQGAGVQGTVITTDGRFVYVANRSGFVSVISTGSDSLVGKITTPGTPYGLAITPDGRFVYVAGGSSNLVYVIDTTTRKVVSTINVSNPTNIVAGQTDSD